MCIGGKAPLVGCTLRGSCADARQWHSVMHSSHIMKMQLGTIYQVFRCIILNLAPRRNRTSLKDTGSLHSEFHSRYYTLHSWSSSRRPLWRSRKRQHCIKTHHKTGLARALFNFRLTHILSKGYTAFDDAKYYGLVGYCLHSIQYSRYYILFAHVLREMGPVIVYGLLWAIDHESPSRFCLLKLIISPPKILGILRFYFFENHKQLNFFFPFHHIA